MRIERIPLAGGRVTVEVQEGKGTITGLPAGIEVIEEPRHPLRAE